MSPTKTKRLLRSRKDRYIAGVCGGLGEYFDIDPLIFRLIFLIVFFFGGAGLLVYLILWIAIPEEGEDKRSREISANLKEGANKMAEEIKKNKHKASHNQIIGGLLILTVGVIFLVNNFLPGFGMGKLWPLFLIILAIGIITGELRPRKEPEESKEKEGKKERK